MAGKGKGKRLTDSERMEIIAKLEDPSSSMSRVACATAYGVSPAAISKLMKVRQSVKKRYSDAGEGGQRDKRQRGGFSKNVRFEDELYQWICSVRTRKIPLLVSHVQQKAKLLAAQHGMNEGFKASNGWYYRFCGRYGLQPAALHTGASGSGVTASGETQETKVKGEDEETTKELREKVKQVGEEFVYTVSEARLFYQLLPSHIRPSAEAVSEASDGEAAIPAAAVDRIGVTSGGGKTPRVLVLVCTNGTGSHKIPLLVIGKEEAPACLTALHRPSSDGDVGNTGESSTNVNAVSAGIGMGTSFYSQREVWCDDRTFQHWCKRVFLPAIRQRTTRPVLLIAENPGGRIRPFQEGNISTTFLPFRVGNGSSEVSLTTQQNSLATPGAVGNTSVKSYVQLQPLHGAVIRDLKRRYKIGLFHERLSFLEKPDDERFHMLQRAMKKPVGSAGVSLGRIPHLLDAMQLLDEAWEAIPSALICSSWIKSNLGGTTCLSMPAPMPMNPSDDIVVLELCYLIRTVVLVEDVTSLGNELRQWLSIDDDSSERMQQELLYDIQQLLQEEKQQASDKESTQQQQLQELQLQEQQQNTSAFMDDTSDLTTADPNKLETLIYHNADRGDGQPAATMDSNFVLHEKHKAISNALQALAAAEEAMDNADAVDFFGEDATCHTIESVSRALRKLHRIQRGKQSPLVAVTVNANASSDGNDGCALATHEYFYGSGNAP